MKQVLIKKGVAYIDDIPSPACGDGEVLVEVKYSLISNGTEMTSLVNSGKSLLTRAKEQPNSLSLVLDVIKKQGLKKTFNLVKGVLGSGTPTGYSASGVVVEVGSGINNYQIGDRVACAGAGKANHAEVISVPKNLVVKIPYNVDFSDAASVTLGTIALQGIRQADPKLGDIVVVIGLGLIGLLTVQMLKANGCTVIGVDLDKKRLQTAKEFGADLVIEPVEALQKIMKSTDNNGADKIIIAAATESNIVVNQAMRMVRKKGVVIVVGAVGLALDRSPFYEKEVDFKISCSYGPGRYDSNYEEKGIDYPIGYVRWTENRNMYEYLKLISAGQINFKKLVEAEYIIDEAARAYDDLKNFAIKPLGVLLKYPESSKKTENLIIFKEPAIIKNNKKIINVAIIGAGGFASGVHLPNLEKLKDKYKIQAIIDKNGVTAKQIAEKYGAKYTGTDYEKILKQKDVDMVLITTRHDLHAKIAIKALKEGKSVFCEKPMAVNPEELDKLSKQIQKSKGVYTVGFNRRFSPFAEKIKKLVQDRQNPLMIYYRMNAGYIPLDHWVHNQEGGGRIIGEGCHIFDLFNFIVGNNLKEITSLNISPKTAYYSPEDNRSIVLKYDDGSVCTLIYTALGSNDMPKEYMEVYFDGKSIIMEDYRKMIGYGTNANMTSPQDKGHLRELLVFYDTLTGKSKKWPINLSDMVKATKTTFLI